MRWPHRMHPPLIVGLFGLYLCLYPGSLVVVALDRVPAWGTWVGGLLIMLKGTLCGLWLLANYHWRGAAAALCIGVGSFAVEHVGVTTGTPFGQYYYTNELWPKLWGVVPLAIPFAWLLIVPAALGAARYLARPAGFPIGPVSPLWLALVAATMALLMDIVLEPVVTLVNGYWVWVEGSNYYGVPLANFAAWWYVSFALIVCTLLFTRNAPPVVLPHLPFWLYLLSLCMFTVVNLAHNLFAAAAIGGLILGYLLFHRLEWRLVRWVLQGQAVLAPHTDQ